jgi:hypothetical protein
MIIILHIACALSSLAFTTYTYISPSARKLQTAYGLGIATLASGTYLVVSTQQPLLSSCLSGLAYLSVMALGIGLARRKLLRAIAVHADS